MSGRVGDLNPKQKEALAKVSFILARPRPRPGPGPRPLAAAGREGAGWGASDGPRQLGCSASSSRGTWQIPSRPSSLCRLRGPREI